MHSTFAIAALFAAVGINAAPAAAATVASVPLSIFESASCGTGPTAAETANIPTDGSCFPISFIRTGPTDAGIILSGLPAGCSVTLYSDSTCTSQNFLVENAVGQCATFGSTNVYIMSARTSGTC